MQKLAMFDRCHHSAGSNVLIGDVMFFSCEPVQRGDHELLQKNYYTPVEDTNWEVGKCKPESVSVNWFNSSSSCSVVKFRWLYGTAGSESSRSLPGSLGSPEGRRGLVGTSGKPDTESGFDSSNRDFSSSSNSSMSSPIVRQDRCSSCWYTYTQFTV